MSLSLVARGFGVVVEGGASKSRSSAFCRRETGLVGVLSEIPAAVGHGLGSPAVQCEFQGPSNLLKGD